MGELTRAEVVNLSGATDGLVDEFVALGLIVPDGAGGLTSSDVRRVTILRLILEAGLPIEAVADAVRAGDFDLDFVDDDAYQRFASFSAETFAEASARTGVPLELLGVVREVTGAPPPHPDDRLRADELPILDFLALQRRLGFRPAASERLLRAQGDSLRRSAESEAEWWRTEVIGPARARGAELREMSAPDFSPAMAAALEASIVSLYRALQMRAWTANIIASTEARLVETGRLDRRERQPAIVFLDVTGYTQLTEERGDAAAADLAERLGRIVQRTSVAHGGRPVKHLGDGVMFVFPEPGPAVLAALEMVDGVAAADLPPAHVGVASGPVIFQEGDYYGQTVNLAARISDFARPGEVLVSEAVVAASGLPEGSFEEVGPVELKGVSGPVRLLAARST
ncbi:MAG TPA: adenylate/guanylate cyclase domain-containing protein [Candidatus Limnocylindrales bacterium]|nr:adenylate/guanylate cyclase domain-containing protein [Candidatus Limnocylindrales bacterium]